MAYKFCPECGFKIDREYKFCPECGYNLGEAVNEAPQPLFDFSEDTAKYGNAKFAGFDEQLNGKDTAEKVAAKAPKRPKNYKEIKDENNLRLEEKTFVSDLKNADIKVQSATSSKQRQKDERELAERFNKYFNEYNELSSENGIEIKRDVPPDYFGAHPECKPVHFLFKKDGKDNLAVMIVSKNNYGHPAVKNVLRKCRGKIKCLVFFLYMPNTEHYVMRRVLEELYLINRVY